MSIPLIAQRIITQDGHTLDSVHNHFASDSIDSKSIPTGLYVWRVSEYFGDTISDTPDTLTHHFPNSNYTAGTTMQYSHTGNIGAPRLSRLFKAINTLHTPFIFTQPYDFFYKKPSDVLFTNTKSPFTNITYHSRGNRITGDDHFKLRFATNINKRLGFGVDVDYIYGRGYYASQATSLTSGRLHGSYLGQNYHAHFFVESNYTKMAENGGLEDDGYIITPQNYSANYSTSDYPTRLTQTWNRTGLFRTYLSHRYLLGIHRTYLPNGTLVKEQKDAFSKKLTQPTDSNQIITIDSIQHLPFLPQPHTPIDSSDESSNSPRYIRQFTPIMSLFHTFQFDKSYRKFTQNTTPKAYYTNAEFYPAGSGSNDKTDYLGLSNLLGIEVIEGFNKWVKAGMKLFIRYDLRSFQLPTNATQLERYNDNLLSLGALLYRKQSHYFRFEALGELATNGTTWGMFNLKGEATLRVPLAHDTLTANFSARLANEIPTFYYRHYHSRYTWWDNTHLNNILTSQLGGTISHKKSTLRLNIHSLQNYTYFAETATPNSGNTWGYTTAISVKQSSKNLQVIAFTIKQQFDWRMLHGELNATYQTSSNQDALPLPKLTAYANLYLLFRLAKVLGVELGIDGSYFTKYYAPTYTPVIGQFATQDANYRTKVGNYPVLNAYANFHLSKCRFYIAYTHLNQNSNGGRPFMIPHNPLNPRGLQLGISWTFLN